MTEGFASYGRVRHARFPAAALGLALFAACPKAWAVDQAPTGSGIAGGALLGAELSALGQALFGVRSPAAYAVGALVGAGVGAAAGYVVENHAHPDASMALFGAGLALGFPTLVWVGNSTARDVPPVPVRNRARRNAGVGVQGTSLDPRARALIFPLVSGVF